jgi:hypothetical protein
MGQAQTRNQIKSDTVTHFKVLTKDEARKALDEANSLDFFSDRIALDDVNRAARQGLAYEPTDGPEIPFTLKGSYKSQYRIVYLDPTAEAGMPHTRSPDLICLPAYFETMRLKETLKHEMVHINQRENPEKWVAWCIENGWTLVRQEDIPERWVRRCRLNPDTMAYRFWAFRDRWVPLPFFEREDRPKLRDVLVKWWDKQTGSLSQEVPMELQGIVQGVGSYEHPWEIAAYKEIFL